MLIPEKHINCLQISRYVEAFCAVLWERLIDIEGRGKKMSMVYSPSLKMSEKERYTKTDGIRARKRRLKMPKYRRGLLLHARRSYICFRGHMPNPILKQECNIISVRKEGFWDGII